MDGETLKSRLEDKSKIACFTSYNHRARSVHKKSGQSRIVKIKRESKHAKKTEYIETIVGVHFCTGNRAGGLESYFANEKNSWAPKT